MKGLNRIELIVGGILVLIFLVWSFDTCSTSNKKYQPQEPAKQEEPKPQADNNTNPNQPAANNDAANPTPAQPAPVPVQTAPTYTIVYVSTEKLNMRDKPFLSGSQIVTELRIGDELYYLNNKSEYKAKITLDNIPYEEPWIEVQTKDGKRGWVYGGGIRFYK